MLSKPFRHPRAYVNNSLLLMLSKKLDSIATPGLVVLHLRETRSSLVIDHLLFFPAKVRVLHRIEAIDGVETAVGATLVGGGGRRHVHAALLMLTGIHQARERYLHVALYASVAPCKKQKVGHQNVT